MSHGWAKASACRLQVSLSCAVLCQIVSIQYLSRSSLHRLAGLPCRLFLSYGLQVVIHEVHQSSLKRLICPEADQYHFIFFTLLIISMTFVFSLTQMLVFLSLYVMLSILISILVCAAASLFCTCCLCTICHSRHCLAAVMSCTPVSVAFEDIPVFGVCRPACHDSSLYLFVLVIFLEAVALYQVYGAFNILSVRDNQTPVRGMFVVRFDLSHCCVFHIICFVV